MSEFKDTWSEFSSLYQELRGVDSTFWGNPATPEQIEELKSITGLTNLPGDFLEYLQVCNGTGEKFVVFPWRLLSVTDMINEWQEWSKHLESKMAEYNAGAVDPGIRPQWYCLEWLPFAKSGKGDIHCIDFSPANQGTLGQVISVFKDRDERKYLAYDITGYVAKLRNAARNQDIVLIESEIMAYENTAVFGLMAYDDASLMVDSSGLTLIPPSTTEWPTNQWYHHSDNTFPRVITVPDYNEKVLDLVIDGGYALATKESKDTFYVNLVRPELIQQVEVSAADESWQDDVFRREVIDSLLVDSSGRGVIISCDDLTEKMVAYLETSTGFLNHVCIIGTNELVERLLKSTVEKGYAVKEILSWDTMDEM